MCGRFTLVTSADELAGFLKGFIFPSDLLPRYNVAPAQDVAVALNDGSNHVRSLRWGLVPFWAKDPAIGSRMINARAETLTGKPAFRDAFRQRRCLVFADSFYEWKRTSPKEKQPMRIRLETGRPFAFAGLWDAWRSPDGDRIGSCAIVTTVPNELLAGIHNRMPVILHSDAYETWLEPGEASMTKLQSLLGPYDAGEMEAYPVSLRVNNVRYDGPACIAPLAVPTSDDDEGQLKLF